jgi:hypothetical protein
MNTIVSGGKGRYNVKKDKTVYRDSYVKSKCTEEDYKAMEFMFFVEVSMRRSSAIQRQKSA